MFKVEKGLYSTPGFESAEHLFYCSFRQFSNYQLSMAEANRLDHDEGFHSDYSSDETEGPEVDDRDESVSVAEIPRDHPYPIKTYDTRRLSWYSEMCSFLNPCLYTAPIELGNGKKRILDVGSGDGIVAFV